MAVVAEFLIFVPLTILIISISQGVIAISLVLLAYGAILTI
jgi:hypothetical protein